MDTLLCQLSRGNPMPLSIKRTTVPWLLVPALFGLLALYSTKILTRLGMPWIFYIADDPLYPPQHTFGIAVSHRFWEFPFSPMIYATLVLVLLLSFFFRKQIDITAHSALVAFMASFIVEMYGVAFSLYLLFSALGEPAPLRRFWSPSDFPLFQHFFRYPSLLVGWSVGVTLIWVGWRGVHRGRNSLVTTGIYAWIRHPQYLGMAFIALGTLLFCPTPMQLTLFVALTILYLRLSAKEDRDLEQRYGQAFLDYRAQVGRFLPRPRRARG